MYVHQMQVNHDLFNWKCTALEISAPEILDFFPKPPQTPSYCISNQSLFDYLFIHTQVNGVWSTFTTHTGCNCKNSFLYLRYFFSPTRIYTWRMSSAVITADFVDMYLLPATMQTRVGGGSVGRMGWGGFRSEGGTCVSAKILSRLVNFQLRSLWECRPRALEYFQ